MRTILYAERERLLALKANLVLRSTESESSGMSELGGYDQHPADMASETFERAKDLSILVGIDASLVEVERAVDRLDTGQYGTCEACGKPIDARRLEALPAARFCKLDQSRTERERVLSTAG